MIEFSLNWIKEIISTINLFFINYSLVNKIDNTNNNILEFPINYIIKKEEIYKIPLNNKLLQDILMFISNNHIINSGILISLSGGVDSMVLLRLLIEARNYRDFEIFAIMINYNLRDESVLEAKFLEKYCSLNNVNLTTIHIENAPKDRKEIGSSKRKIFEEETKDIRYNSYQKIIIEHELKGVVLGHHKDDIIENIFTNLLKGHNILDLEVMKETSNKKKVNIFRPLLKYYKSSIYELAYEFDVPYFKDTTPEWSRRGQMRNTIFPLLNNIFGESWKHKLKEIGNQSNLLHDTVSKHLIDPWINLVNFTTTSSGNKNFIFGVPIRYTNDICLWYYIFPKLFYMSGYNTIKKKSIERLFSLANSKNNNNNKMISLDSGFNASKIEETIYIHKS